MGGSLTPTTSYAWQSTSCALVLLGRRLRFLWLGLALLPNPHLQFISICIYGTVDKYKPRQSTPEDSRRFSQAGELHTVFFFRLPSCALHLWSQEQFAKVHVELNAHLYYGAAEACVYQSLCSRWDRRPSTGGTETETGNDTQIWRSSKKTNMCNGFQVDYDPVFPFYTFDPLIWRGKKSGIHEVITGDHVQAYFGKQRWGGASHKKCRLATHDALDFGLMCFWIWFIYGSTNGIFAEFWWKKSGPIPWTQWVSDLIKNVFFAMNWRDDERTKMETVERRDDSALLTPGINHQ